MKKIISLLFTLFLVNSTFAFDQLTLLNKATFEGWVTSIDDKVVQFNFNQEVFNIPIVDVETIVFENTLNPLLIKFQEKCSEDACSKGSLDAEMYHGKKGVHFALGMLFGPFSMIGTALSNPNPRNSKHTYIDSQNKDYFNNAEYLLCYKKTAKRKLIGMEALGWATWILIVLL
jgi:hypothetical protein